MVLFIRREACIWPVDDVCMIILHVVVSGSGFFLPSSYSTAYKNCTPSIRASTNQISSKQPEVYHPQLATNGWDRSLSLSQKLHNTTKHSWEAHSIEPSSTSLSPAFHSFSIQLSHILEEPEKDNSKKGGGRAYWKSEISGQKQSYITTMVKRGRQGWDRVGENDEECLHKLVPASLSAHWQLMECD